MKKELFMEKLMDELSVTFQLSVSGPGEFGLGKSIGEGPH